MRRREGDEKKRRKENEEKWNNEKNIGRFRKMLKRMWSFRMRIVNMEIKWRIKRRNVMRNEIE